MELNIRKLKEEDYDIFSDWWVKWDWPVLPKEFLPNNGTGGYMVEKNGIPIVCGFVYETNSKWYLFEWIVSNPKYRDKDRKQAIELLITSVQDIYSRKGVRALFAVGRNNKLIEIKKKLGWIVEPKPSYELTKMI